MRDIAIAAIAAVAPTVAVFVSFWLSHRERMRAAVKLAANNTTLTDNNEKLKEIHVLVNGRLSEAIDKIATLEADIQTLEAELHAERAAQ